MPRRAPLKPRQKGQGVKRIIKYLRMVIEDENTPPWLKVVCIDRLAKLDTVYEVTLETIQHTRFRKPSAVNNEIEQASEVLEPVEQLEEDLVSKSESEKKAVLDEFNRRYFNSGGSNV